MEKKWFIGVDISKNTLDIVLYLGESKRPSESNYIKVSNNEIGFKIFTEWLKDKKINPADLILCMEHTGMYGFDFCLYLEDSKIDYTMVSALHLKRSMGFVRGKSDKVDAFRIARYCFEKRDFHVLFKLKGSTVIKLRELHNEHKLYVRQKATHKGYLTDSKDRQSQNEVIRARAEKTVAYFDEQIKLIEQQMQEVISTDQAFDKNYTLLTSIKGIGVVNAINAVVHTNNFTCFENGRQYACYLGIAPFGYESGTSVKKATKVSKQGAKFAKADLSQAAKSAVVWDKEMKEYYDRKRAEGKSYGVVMNAIKFKLVLRMFAVVKRGTPWVDLKLHCN